MIKNRLKIEIVVGIIIFIIGAMSGYNNRKIVIQEKIIRVDPEIKVVEKILEIPKWRDRLIYKVKTITVNKTVIKEIIITSSNAKELAENFQNELQIFETAELKITMEPWIIKNGIPQKEIDLNAELYYLSWKMKIKNKFKVLTEEQKVFDTPLMFGLNYSLKGQNINLVISKEFIKVPFLNIPVTLGIGYSF